MPLLVTLSQQELQDLPCRGGDENKPCLILVYLNFFG